MGMPLHWARPPSAHRLNFAQQPRTAQPQFPGSTKTEWQSLRPSHQVSLASQSLSSSAGSLQQDLLQQTGMPSCFVAGAAAKLAADSWTKVARCVPGDVMPHSSAHSRVLARGWPRCEMGGAAEDLPGAGSSAAWAHGADTPSVFRAPTRVRRRRGRRVPSEFRWTTPPPKGGARHSTGDYFFSCRPPRFLPLACGEKADCVETSFLDQP